ncbi:hypothetical protein JCM10207_002093 [Rhodosporidiobolus poonsookiae]
MEDAKEPQSVTPLSPFSQHLSQYRFASPSSSFVPPTRKQPPRLASTSKPPDTPPKPSSTKGATPRRPTATPPRRTATPPRTDGSSRFFKREADEAEVSDEGETPKKKRKRPARPYADPSVYSHLGDDPLTDYMVEDGRLMLCGINPGRLSAEKGLHYANPTNHYWRCLSGSGLTDRLLDPSEGPLLSTQYGISATNLVARPSAEMSEISNDEMKASVPSLLRKIVKYRPSVVGFVGMKICEVVMRYLHNLPKPAVASPSKRRVAMPKVKVGLQAATISVPLDDESKETKTVYLWCLPSTSARVVEYQLVDKIKIFTQLKADIDKLHASPPVPLDLPPGTVDYPAERLFPPEVEVKVEAAVKVEASAAASEGGGWRLTLVQATDLQASSGVKEEEA